MVAELHCHTSEHSACSHVNAIELIKRACDLGLQAIIITDHHYQWTEDALAEIKKRSGVPDIFDVLAGQEFNTSDYGDILLYGAPETVERQKLTLEEIRKRFPEAAIIWAHPFRNNKIPPKEKLLNPLHDGIEIFSSNYTVMEAARALKAYHELKFTAIAGTDTHALSYTGSYPTIFDHAFTTIEEMVKEIKNGRCRPFFKEIPRTGTSDTKVTEVVIGPKASKDRKKMIIKSFEDYEGWKEGERSFYIVKEILQHGFENGKYRIPHPLEKDENNLSLIEEKISGDTLYDALLKSDTKKGREYLRMAADWLAELHNLNLKISPVEEYLAIEKPRLDYYLSGMYAENHIHTERARQILNEVWKNELELINSNPQALTQGHGDFHLKNIYTGNDKNTGEEYLAAIDFDSSYLLPKAFDVGTFISQYRNMFFDNNEIPYRVPSEIFLEEYLSRVNSVSPNFESEVYLYRARANLSIIYYLVKVGMGNSENFWTALVDAERNITNVAFRSTG